MAKKKPSKLKRLARQIKSVMNKGGGQWIRGYYLTSAIRPAPRVDQRYGLNAETWAGSGTWVGVKSTDVGAIMYDRKKAELFVEFRKSGNIYYYANVPPQVAIDMYNTNSMGRFVHYRLIPFFIGRKTLITIPVGAKRFASLQ